MLYWYMSPGIVAESDLSGNLTSEYVFFNGERVARRDNPSGASPTIVYYFSDHLKTTDIVTDATGHILNESDYYPWGGELQFANADSNHYKFTGKERDSETGLDYFGARYYSNGLGRWISADWSATPIPVPYADLTDPQSLNLYSYVRNVPTSRADLDGHAQVAPEDPRKLKQGECNAVGCRLYDYEIFQNRINAMLDAFPKEIGNEVVGLYNFTNRIGCALSKGCTAPIQAEIEEPDGPEQAKMMAAIGIATLFLPETKAEKLEEGGTYLYARFSKSGVFRKWGITDTPLTRYKKWELGADTLEIVATGTREKMLRLEKWLIERAPGPKNADKFRGLKYSERALRAVERVLDRLRFGNVQ